MKAQLLKLLQLKQLYTLKSCVQGYTDSLKAPLQAPPKIEKSLELTIKNCSLCQRVKHCKGASFGLLNPDSKLCFISDIPLLDENQHFIQSKSGIMLDNIISKVFGLNLTQVSILSLVKCDPQNLKIQPDELHSCLGFIQAQLSMINPAIHILLGDNVSEALLGGRFEHSRILWHNDKKFLISYALNELIRNPSLKSRAKNDFDIAKGQL